MWNGNSKQGEQVITLRRWAVVAVVTRRGTRSRHVWGHDLDADAGRVSDAITGFDMASMTITTANGTRYRLGGLPGHARKGQIAWDDWCRAHEVSGQMEVTNDYMDPDDVSTRQFVALNISAFGNAPK